MNYSNINMTNCPFLNISLELKKYHINIYIYIKEHLQWFGYSL